MIMSLAVGIVGLPNVGKSTLFNALLKKQQALVANYPFATIEPNVGIVPVPDRRLEFLAETTASQNSKSEILNSKQIQNPNFQFQNKDKWPPIVPATVEFLDIAGLIAGAHKGEGLGNKFLSHIREVDAIVHVVRAFTDSNVIKEGSVDPKSDFETVKLELDLADIEMVQKHEKKKNAQVEELPLLAKKPFLVAVNVDEGELGMKNEELRMKYATDLGVDAEDVVIICAKVEAELAELSEDDRKDYLKELGILESGLERMIKAAYHKLGLMTFLTAGEKEARAWTIKRNTKAPQAAGVIHTDFEKKFIKADVVSFEDFVGMGGWKNCREKGKVRSEGRDYVMKEGDVVEFKIGT